MNESDLNAIKEVLSGNNTYGLECEILYEAFNAIRENTKLTISEAINIGFIEVVK